MCKRSSSLPTDPVPPSSYQHEPYLENILRQQAQQLVGRPGWPDTVAAVYQRLLEQIEADISAGPRTQLPDGLAYPM